MATTTTPSKLAKTAAFIAALGPWGWGAIAAGVAAVFIWGALVFVIEPRHAAVVKAQAHIASAETSVAADAAKTVSGLEQTQATKTLKVQQTQAKNAQAIEKLPSAATTIPDADADAFIRGLCMYDSTHSDSACARLPKASS